ncbi:IS256 family transposase [Picosynechococcus sp. NKBG042902]|uniref:IS256 family transposase n=1 Tax=Picosynechococcus sp. NKBG042902 TaxID=490193 RepID=UPI0004AAE4F1|nr:IS256 family transposase [Picosynechococcus sp. NKBG042902]
MDKDNLISLPSPEATGTFQDTLTEILRKGARQLIAQAVEEELQNFLAQYKDQRDKQGRKMVVRNGYLPERSVITGIGEVQVKVPKVRDRSGSGIKFNSLLLPPYLKRSKSTEELLPWLYLKGISTGDFQEALGSLLGEEASGLSPATISRLKQKWVGEHQAWQQRSLQQKRYVYVWADGIYFNIRAEERQCILVLIGVTENGEKELLALAAGYRESALSWKPLLLSLKQRGLAIAPELAIGDGSLGFWNALAQVYPETRKQRCWVHKTANILDKLPKKQQMEAKEGIWQIYRAGTKADALQAYERFIQTYEAKYPEATKCLEKDRDSLFTFFDFPAPHWQHIRSTNPIESTFATVRLRTDKTRGCVSKATILALVFKLMQSAQKRWLRIRGFKYLADVIEGVPFKDGLKVQKTPPSSQQQDAA